MGEHSKKRPDRRDRLQAALRENLKRRKVQARNRARSSDVGAPGEADTGAENSDHRSSRPRLGEKS